VDCPQELKSNSIDEMEENLERTISWLGAHLPNAPLIE
jgi:hypothetical protein